LYIGKHFYWLAVIREQGSLLQARRTKGVPGMLQNNSQQLRQASMYKLVIANRNYSSWSLRAWLHLVESNIPFEEIRIPLYTGSWQQEIARYSPGGLVPVLLDDGITVWDSMAIIEYIREQHPDAVGWPEPGPARACARSVSAEMHSGFLAVRNELPQNLRAGCKLDVNQLSASCQKQIARIDEIWSDCRRTHGGPGKWLFGDFSIADVMFAPVALRFVTYSIPVSNYAREFIEAVRGLNSVQQWTDAARAEPESISLYDTAADSP
jgi:glutathione S-transferase